MANSNSTSHSRFLPSISYVLSKPEHEQIEMDDLKCKRTRSHGSLVREHNSEVDWSMRTIDRSESSEEHDPSRLQTVSVHFRELGHFKIPYHTRQIDELREVLYFHPFDIPKRVPLGSFAVEGSESFRSMIVVIESRDKHLKDKLTNMTHTLRKKLIRFGYFLKSFVRRDE
ncbi:hypothetical protein SCHPADRAFT_934835 [Schizopora paradoxa]|uniref:Uncharacterized protein n=1 Tax=Schizopora paradoxa TaxID=27342 RepID=A0A0H2SSX9_9AGAM|nr:hypothetical protein SCHPADRAFT_934835 [Schizopora paradoxa]